MQIHEKPTLPNSLRQPVSLRHGTTSIGTSATCVTVQASAPGTDSYQATIGYHHRFFMLEICHICLFSWSSLILKYLPTWFSPWTYLNHWGMGTSRISNPPCSWPVPTCQRVEGLITAKAVSCPPFWHSYLSLSMVLNHIISYHIISYHIISYHIISYHIRYHTSCHQIVCYFVLNALHQFYVQYQYMNWLSSILLSMSWHLEANGSVALWVPVRGWLGDQT